MLVFLPTISSYLTSGRHAYQAFRTTKTLKKTHPRQIHQDCQSRQRPREAFVMDIPVSCQRFFIHLVDSAFFQMTPLMHAQRVHQVEDLPVLINPRAWDPCWLASLYGGGCAERKVNGLG